MTEYLPKDASVPSSSTPEDQHYAQAFQDVAEVLRLSGDAERLTLLLSTCRNAYLTINALFRDLVEVLGHGAHPSLLSSALFLLKQGQFDRAHEPLDEAAAALSIFTEKRTVWEDRHALKATLDSTLAEKVDALVRDRVVQLTRNVRTSDGGHSTTWDPRFYEFSQTEPATLSESLAMLDQTARVLTAITSVARAIAALPVEDLLFGSEIEAQWPRLRRLLVQHAAALALVLVPATGDGTEAITWNLDGHIIEFPDIPESGAAGIPPGVAPLLAHLDAQLRAEYERLRITFRPNIGQPPLPPPFLIDLSEPQSREIWWPAPEAERHQFGREIPPTVRVALPLIGIPLAYFNTTQDRYRDQFRPEIERLARTAIQAAGNRGADVVVFPECFLPRSSAQELADLAASLNVTLIGGLEGHLDGDASLQNEALIRFPDHARLFLQSKQMESVYEPKLRVTGGVRIFQGTRIGTFAVVVCSDALEWGVLSALASAPTDLHLTFICAMNPHPELFKCLAIADAARLYCHVVIANNRTNPRQPSEASGEGTLVCSPRRDSCPIPSVPKFALGLPSIGGTAPEMVIHEVSVGSLLTSRRQRVGDFLPFPASRVRKAGDKLRMR